MFRIPRPLLPFLLGATGTLACASDFDATRKAPPRGTLGQELYTLMCDRIGAQALPDDVTGSSFHAVCHADAKGEFADKVDQTQLPPITAGRDAETGEAVGSGTIKANRKRRVGRVEALARRRDELIKALDTMLPDVDLDVPKSDGKSAKDTCDDAPSGKKLRYRKALADTMGRFLDLYEDGTVPEVTRSLGDVMKAIQADPEAQAALSRLQNRLGYRPQNLALGVARPMLAYPRLTTLATTLLSRVAENARPYDPKGAGPGTAKADLDAMLDAMAVDLRTADPPKEAPLKLETDAATGLGILSRPRTKLEVGREILLRESDTFTTGTSLKYVAQRDRRGFVLVPGVPSPFVDDGSGLAKLDDIGRFVTTDGSKPPTPLFAFGGQDGKRDEIGRALLNGTTPYAYRTVSKTFLARILSDIRPLIDPKKGDDEQALLNILAGVPILMGKLAPTASTKNGVTYRPFQADKAPMLDLLHAMGQTMNDPAVDDALALFTKLLREQPNKVARIVGIGFKLKEIADKHPEANVPEASTIWDDMLDTFAKIAHAPGVFEDLYKAFGDDRTVKLREVFAAYAKYKDHLTYYRDPSDKQNEAKLNGPAFNQTTGKVEPMKTLVDRTLADSGENRSALQRFMQILHDANGLAACTKAGAVAHVNIEWPMGSGIKIMLDYPTNPLVKLVCPVVGAKAPDKLPLCGVLRIENVAALLLDVALDKAQFDVRDECLKKIMESPLSSIVGGADAFLEQASGIKGFSTHPTVPGIARFVHFSMPYDDPVFGKYAGDGYYTNTGTFLSGVLDPVPSMVCDPAPFVDPSDGKTFQLRKCKSIKDTIAVRDADGLFPVEQLDFVKNVTPLAEAFYNNKQSLLFVELFDRMHLHWGSNKQTKEECDPSLPKANARWCSQDGAVTYEPLLAEMLETDLFPTIYDLVNTLKTTTIEHCDAWSGSTCTKTTTKNGIDVLAQATRVMLDPALNQGLTNRKGSTKAVRNDGVELPQTTPVYLLIDALKGFDAAFNQNGFDDPEGPTTWARWKGARSQIVDTLFAIEGDGAAAHWKNAAIQDTLPVLLDILRAQVRSHCTPGASCAWAKSELVANAADSISGAQVSTTMALLETLRKDPEARAELVQLVSYLLDSAENDAKDTTYAAVTDLLQVMEDRDNLSAIFRVVAKGVSRPGDGDAATKSFAHAIIELLSRVFAKAYDDAGQAQCRSALDPHETLKGIFQRAVAPMDATGATPIEVLLSIIADVNRYDPNETNELAPADNGNVAKEVSRFLLDPGRGLEQVYDTIKNVQRVP